MKVVKNNWLRIYRAKEETLDWLRDEFTFKNPDYFRAKALIDKGAIGRDALPSKYEKLYKDFDDHLAIPPAAGKAVLKRAAKKFKELFVYVDETSEGNTISFSLPFRGKFKKWQNYQDELIKTIIEYPDGTYVCPTGGGKTLVALGVINYLKLSALIIVDRRDLLKQWLDELEEKSEGNYTIGQFGGGKKKWGDVTIALVQSLKNLSMPEIEKVKNKFGIVFVDEVHKASAPTFQIGRTIFNTKYSIGLTATAKRKDKKEFIFKNYVGTVRLEIPDEVVIEEGRIVPVKYRLIHTGFRCNYSELQEDITLYPVESLSDYDRNNVIIQEVEKDLEDGFVPIVFSNRVPHCQYLYETFRERGWKVGLFIGRVPKEKRDRYKELMKDGYLDIMVANISIAGTGLDIPILSSAHITFFTSNEVMLKQAAGRVRRAIKNKEFGKINYYVDDVYIVEVNKTTAEKIEKPSSSFQRNYKNVKRLFKKWKFEKIDEK